MIPETKPPPPSSVQFDAEKMKKVVILAEEDMRLVRGAWWHSG